MYDSAKASIVKNKTYVVYCKVGERIKIAQKLMQKFGFVAVHNIIGGTLLWEEEGLPRLPYFRPGLYGKHPHRTFGQ